MTRYENISAMASNYAAAFMNQRFASERLALVLRSKFQAYLEAPDTALSFVALDDHLQTLWTPLDSPKVTQGNDGFWYFGLLVSFQAEGSASYSKVALKFGCLVRSDRAELKLERSYGIDSKDETTWDPLLSDLEADLLAHYTRGPTEPPRSIGFLSDQKP